MSEPTEPSAGPFRQFWVRHRTLFWALHSGWAFATGVAVMILARERYGFVPWVVFFLGLTWASTLFLGRRISPDAPTDADDTPTDADDTPTDADDTPTDANDTPTDAAGATSDAPPPAEEFASYVMRALYQETLFFLLPFYAASTVVTSVNVVFVVLLGGLALLACLDLLFDRLIRSYPTFGFVFFATVSFAAVNLVLPILVPVSPRVATLVATAVALGSSLPLARGDGSRRHRVTLVIPALALVAATTLFPSVIPPAPLRLERTTFTSAVDRTTVQPVDTLPSSVRVDRLNGRVAVVLEVFAPSRVPAAVALEWTREGESLRTTRDITITAHELGFSVWDAWRPPAGAVQPGRYEVTIRTSHGQIFGRSSIQVMP